MNMQSLLQPRSIADVDRTLALARETMTIEADAVYALSHKLGDAFLAAHKLLFEAVANKGRVVVTGMGKSGHIGGKIASTLSSTGTPAFFMHPGEASHGDLGMIAAGDVVIAISNAAARRLSPSPAGQIPRWRKRPRCISMRVSKRKPAH